MTSAPPVDHIQLGLSRVATQFQESKNLLAFLRTLLAGNSQVDAALQSLFLLPSIDDMSGVNLDTIGIIVGVSRFVTAVVDLSYFGFEDTGYYATCFGEEGVPNIGSRFYEEGESYQSTTILQDPEFRMMIRAKIAKNGSKGTCEEIINGLRLLFNTEDVHVTDNLDMSISIAVGRPLYATELTMLTTLDLLPRPAGVRVAGEITSYVPPAEDYSGGEPPYGDI